MVEELNDERIVRYYCDLMRDEVHAVSNVRLDPNKLAATESEDAYNKYLQEHEALMEEIAYKVFTPDEVRDLLQELWCRLDRYRNNEEMLLSRLQDEGDQLAILTNEMMEANKTKEEAVGCLSKIEQEVVSVKRKLDASHLREQDYQELVTSLRNQTKSLEVELEKTRKEQEELAQELGISGRSKEAYYRDKERLKQQNAELKKDIVMLQSMQEELGKQLVDVQSALENSEQQLTEMKMQNAELIRDRGVIGREASNQKTVVKRLKKCLILLKTNHDSLKTKLEAANSTLEEQKKGLTDGKVENKELKIAVTTHLQHLNELNRKMVEIMKEKSDMKREDQLRERHYRLMKKKIQNIEMIENRALKAMERSKSLKKAIEMEKIALRDESKTSLRDLNDLKDKLKSQQKIIFEMEREKKVASAQLLRAAGIAQENIKKLNIEMQLKRSTEIERDRLRIELHQRFMENTSLLAEKERLKSEILEQQEKIEEGLLNVKHKESVIAKMKKELYDYNIKFKKSTSLYEEVKSERNIYASVLNETKEEVDSYKKMHKQLLRQNEQLKEQLTTKDNTVFIMKRELKKKEGEVVKVDMRLTRIKGQLKSARNQVNTLEKDRETKSRMIDHSVKANGLVKNEIEGYQQEIAKVTTLLDRKVANATLLQQKLDTLEFILKKGENQYNQRLDDIKLLKMEILKLRREKAILLKAFENMADLRNEVYLLNKDLSQERQRVRSLEEQMETPLNFHRWRFLEGSDPDHMELIHKVNLLQKKLITCKNEISEKEYQLDEVERYYNSFKQYLDSMPGFDAAETIETLKKTIKDKDTQIKTLSVELSCREGEIKDMKISADVTKKDLDDMKKKFYELKLKDDYAKQKRSNGNSKLSASDDPPMKQILGGGFKMVIKEPNKID